MCPRPMNFMRICARRAKKGCLSCPKSYKCILPKKGKGKGKRMFGFCCKRRGLCFVFILYIYNDYIHLMFCFLLLFFVSIIVVVVVVVIVFVVVVFLLFFFCFVLFCKIENNFFELSHNIYR